MAIPSKLPPGLKIEEPPRSFLGCYSSSAIPGDARLVPKEPVPHRFFFRPLPTSSTEEQDQKAYRLVVDYILKNSSNSHAHAGLAAYLESKVSEELTATFRDRSKFLHNVPIKAVSKEIADHLIAQDSSVTINQIFYHHTQSFYKNNPEEPQPFLRIPLRMRDFHQMEEFVRDFVPPSPPPPSSRSPSIRSSSQCADHAADSGSSEILTQERRGSSSSQSPPRVPPDSTQRLPLSDSPLKICLPSSSSQYAGHAADSRSSEIFIQKRRGSSSSQSSPRVPPTLTKDSTPKLPLQDELLYFTDKFLEIKNSTDPSLFDSPDCIWTPPSPPTSSRPQSGAIVSSKVPFEPEKVVQTLITFTGGSSKQHSQVAEDVQKTAREFEPLNTRQLRRVIPYHVVRKRLPLLLKIAECPPANTESFESES